MTTVTVQQQTKQRVTVTQPVPVTVTVRPTGPKGEQGIQGPPGPTVVVGTVDKKTGVDAGYFGEMSVVDDYLYVCVHGGNATNAIWKRTVLFHT
jgi:hypothetical protein